MKKTASGTPRKRKVRRVGVIVGSDSDLKNHCLRGLQYLLGKEKEGKVKLQCVHTNSQHRHSSLVRKTLDGALREVDVLIIGAGWANHLTGCSDAYLRYLRGNDTVHVLGVAFQNQGRDRATKRRNLAAELSITEVPGTQVVFRDEFAGGEQAFLKACQCAVWGKLPPIKVKAPPAAHIRSFRQAVDFILASQA